MIFMLHRDKSLSVGGLLKHVSERSKKATRNRIKRYSWVHNHANIFEERSTENSMLTPKQQKELIIKEVVKKHFKNAGYKSIGKTFYSVRNDICLAVHIYSSQHNNPGTGFHFCLRINALPADAQKDDIKMEVQDITEECFLPKCGFLHPYHDALGYNIGGYRDYAPKVQKYEEIRDYINNDFEQYIIPGLQKIQCREDYDNCKKEYKQRRNLPEIHMLNFFTVLQMLVEIPPIIVTKFFDSNSITAEEVKANRALYEQVREWSAVPRTNHWESLMRLIETLN